VQRLQHAGERDRAAVRVCENSVVRERARSVHLGHDERDPGLEPVRRGLVDGHRATANRVRHELERRRRAHREEREVDAAGRERLRPCLLDDEAAGKGLPGRARGCEGADVLVAALAQQPQRHRADGARGANHRNARLNH
jgi:hypothetical protein